MKPLLLRSTMAFAVALIASSAIPAFGQSSSSLKARCSQLMTFFDWYGASRSENSDGGRNHTRIGADIECKRGNYQEALTTMEDLLRRKKFDVPAPSAGIAESPAGRAPETAAAALMR